MGGIREYTPVEIQSGGTGTVGYRINAEGVVTVIFDVVKTAAYATPIVVILPEEAWQAAPNVSYFDWTGGGLDLNANLHGPVLNLLIYSLPDTERADKLSWQGVELPLPIVEHSLANVQAGLAAALATIPKLRVYDFPSDRVEPPAAVLSLPETPYDITLGGRTDEWTFPLWVLVAKADDKSAYGEMVDYLEPEGERSIRAAIEADRTLGGACDTAAVVSARPLFATVAGTEFLAVEFTLEVIT